MDNATTSDATPAQDPLDPNLPFKLSKPLMTHKGELTELALDMPKGRSFIKHGAPYDIVNGEIKLNIASMMNFAADMSGLDALTLEGIEGSDVLPLCYKIVRKLKYDPQNG